VSCSKERIGHTIKASKKRVSFRIVVEGVTHTFQVEHSLLTGRYSIFFDGGHVIDIADVLDTGLMYDIPVKVEGRVITMVAIDKLRLNPLVFEYLLLIDGNDVKELSQSRFDLMDITCSAS